MAVASILTVGLVIAPVSAQLKELKDQRIIVADEVANPQWFPSSRVFISMLGVDINAAATILLTVDDPGSFKTAEHLASCAGIGSVTRRSGSSSAAKSRTVAAPEPEERSLQIRP